MPEVNGSPDTISWRSRVGLNAANFFLAEITGVVMPFLGAFLKDRKWSETAIGLAISFAGLGVFLMQTPAGMIVDRVQQRRKLLAGASILLGICYGLLPMVPTHPGWVDSLLFAAIRAAGAGTTSNRAVSWRRTVRSPAASSIKISTSSAFLRFVSASRSSAGGPDWGWVGPGVWPWLQLSGA